MENTKTHWTELSDETINEYCEDFWMMYHETFNFVENWKNYCSNYDLDVENDLIFDLYDAWYETEIC